MGRERKCRVTSSESPFHSSFTTFPRKKMASYRVVFRQKVIWDWAADRPLVRCRLKKTVVYTMAMQIYERRDIPKGSFLDLLCENIRHTFASIPQACLNISLIRKAFQRRRSLDLRLGEVYRRQLHQPFVARLQRLQAYRILLLSYNGSRLIVVTSQNRAN